jgi:hypothetical protein
MVPVMPTRTPRLSLTNGHGEVDAMAASARVASAYRLIPEAGRTIGGIDADRRAIDVMLRGGHSADAELGWYYWARIPELRYVARYVANSVSMARLFVGKVTNDPQNPEPVGPRHPANDLLASFAGGLVGQSEVLDRLGLHLTIVGDAVLAGPAEGGPATQYPFDRWRVFSTTEITSRNGKLWYKTPAGRDEPVASGVEPIRVWRPHPRCVDARTEILTDLGWKTHDDLQVGDVVLTLNHVTGLSEWQPVRDIFRAGVAEQPMVEVRTPGHTSSTTANHRWPILKRKRPGFHTERSWTTSTYLNSNDCIIKAARCGDLPTEAKWDDAFVELVAWFWTEGSIAGKSALSTTYGQPLDGWAEWFRARRVALGMTLEDVGRAMGGSPTKVAAQQRAADVGRRGCPSAAQRQRVAVALRSDIAVIDALHSPRYLRPTISLSQSRTANPEKVPLIRQALLTLFGPDAGERMSSGAAYVVPSPAWREFQTDHHGMTYFQLNAAASEMLLEVAPDRVVSREFVRTLTLAQLEVFIRASMLGDGWASRGGQGIGQKYPEMLEGIELACALSGRATNLTTEDRGRYGTFYILRLREYPFQAVAPEKVRHTTYTGTIWCPNTENATWLARRDGKTFYTGNTWWEADSPTRSSYSVLREIDLLDQHVQATAISRLAGAGMLAIPDELTIPGDEVETEGVDTDPFVRQLSEIMALAIKNRESAAAIVPIILRGPAEYIAAIKHFDFATKFDESVTDHRTVALRRLALGMDVPPEIMLGTGDASHWQAWQVDESTLRIHTAPLLQTIVGAITEAGSAPPWRRFLSPRPSGPRSPN